MRIKAEIEKLMRDSVTIADCFSGKILSEDDGELMHAANHKIVKLLAEETSTTETAKRLFDEVLEMDFNEYQWFCLMIILSAQFDMGKTIGAGKTMDFIREMRL